MGLFGKSDEEKAKEAKESAVEEEKKTQESISDMQQQQFEEQCFLIDNWHAINKS